MLRRSPVELEVNNTIGAMTGEGVMVGISERLFLKLVYRFYLLPLLAGLAGAAIAFYLSGVFGLGQGGDITGHFVQARSGPAWRLREALPR